MEYFTVKLSTQERKAMQDVISGNEMRFIRDVGEPDLYFGEVSEEGLKIFTDSLSLMAFPTFRPISHNEFLKAAQPR